MDIQIAFPALAFWNPRDQRSAAALERFRAFITSTDLQTASQRELSSDERSGMVLVDSSGRAWTIVRAWSIAHRTPIWRRALLTVFNGRGSIRHVVRHEFENREPATFSDVQDRVCRAIDSDPDSWRDDEVLAGEDGPPLRLEDVLDALKSRVRRTTTIQEILESFDLDQYYPALQAAAILAHENEP